ncbi:hypothetical protein E4U09_008014 [Claviceps aff. purpurea]|uniref:Uncharacterized protein n=1 Tax=Claviceps aff. purpurea TaxID=1967640 RepID=A0A9P7QPD5_9HYPO|nr:hypothetical protein E4U09_008014 [Claviceps aff. purpurea]
MEDSIGVDVAGQDGDDGDYGDDEHDTDHGNGGDGDGEADGDGDNGAEEASDLLDDAAVTKAWKIESLEIQNACYVA